MNNVNNADKVDMFVSEYADLFKDTTGKMKNSLDSVTQLHTRCHQASRETEC